MSFRKCYEKLKCTNKKDVELRPLPKKNWSSFRHNKKKTSKKLVFVAIKNLSIVSDTILFIYTKNLAKNG